MAVAAGFRRGDGRGGDEAIAHQSPSMGLVDDALHRHNSSQAEDGIPVLLTLGKPAEALALVDRLPNVHDREKKLSTIALLFEKIGDADSALKAAHRLEQPTDTCLKLVATFAAAMQIQRAREAAACTNLLGEFRRDPSVDQGESPGGSCRLARFRQ